MTIQGLYNSVKSGKLSEVEFLAEVKRDSRLKGIITINNNFNDTVSILKNKGIISESCDDKEKDSKFDLNAAIQKLKEVKSEKYNSEHLGYLIKKIGEKEWKIVDSYPSAQDATIAARDKRDARLKGVSVKELRAYGIAQPESHLSWLKEDQLNEGKNKIKGGKGDKLTPDDVNYYEFQKGWKHELEHTDDIDKAKEIALDHLAEDPNYYTHLEMIEFVANKKKRTDLPVEYKKGQEKDKDNQMEPVKSIITSVSGKVANKKIEKHTKNVSDKKEKPKKVKVKTLKENSDVEEAMSVNKEGKLRVQSEFDREDAQTAMEEIGAYSFKSTGNIYILLNKYSYPSMKGGYFAILVRGKKEPIYIHDENDLNSFLDFVEKEEDNIGFFSRQVDDAEYDKKYHKGTGADPSLNETINKKQLKMFPSDKVDVKKVLDLFKRYKKGEDISAEEEQLNKVEKHRLDALKSAKVKESVVDEASKEYQNYEVQAVVNGKVVTKVMSLTKDDYDDMMKTVQSNLDRIEKNKKDGNSRVRVNGPFKITPTTKKAAAKPSASNSKETEVKKKFWWKTDNDNNWSSGELTSKELDAMVDKFRKDNIKVMSDDEYKKMTAKPEPSTDQKVGSTVNYSKFKTPEKPKGTKTKTLTTFSPDALSRMDDKKLKDLMKTQGITVAGEPKKEKPKPKPVTAEPPKGSKVTINPADNSVYLASEKEKKVLPKLFNNRKEAKDYLDKNSNLKLGAYIPVPARAIDAVKQRWGIQESQDEIVSEENLRETIKSLLAKKIKEYNTHQETEGPKVKLKELERLLQGFAWDKPENNYQQINKQEAAAKIKQLVSELGDEGKDLVKQYMPKGGSIEEDHMNNKQDQIDYIVASGHYKGTKDKLALMSDDQIKKIYDTVEKIEKDRKNKKGNGVDLGKSFDKFKKEVK